MADTYTNPNLALQTQGMNAGQAPTGTLANTPINTSTPSPSNTPTTNPQNTGGSIVDALKAGGQASDFTSRTALAGKYGISNYTGTADQNTQLLQKYTAGLANAKSSGVSAPSSQGDAMAGVKSNINATDYSSKIPANDLANFQKANPGLNFGAEDYQHWLDAKNQAPAPNPILDQLKNDPGFQKLQTDYKAYTDTVSKQQSLTDIYSQMEKDSGLPALKLDAMSLKNIIDGSEDDIRTEIQKAGGFATNSQVLALTNARNKQNILDYNKLTDQISNIQSHLDTMIGLSKEDKANALEQYKTQIDYDKTINDYTQKFNDNAKSAYQKIVDAPGYGYKALYDSTGGDKDTISMIEKSLGLPSGTLQSLASQPQQGSYTVVKGGTDAFGNPLPDSIFDTKHGVFVDGFGGGGGVSTGNSGTSGIIGSNGLGSGQSKLSFDQYGLLANTNFKPSDMVDQLSQKYLDQYIKNGTVPTASSLGRNMKPEAMAQVDARARDLYFQATGSPLPNPQIIKGYQQIIDANNKLSNNLAVQEQTVMSNVDLSLANMKKNDLNSSNFQPLNNFINSVQTMFSDPAVGQLIAQNSTIQNELGSLLAVKNASGTTVFDKMASAGIISKNDTEAVVKSKVNALLSEAANFASSLNHANANLYKQVDPFLQDTNNPARQQFKLEQALNSKGVNYNDLSTQMYSQANRDANPGKQPAWDVVNGKPVYASAAEINSGNFLPI